MLSAFTAEGLRRLLIADVRGFYLMRTEVCWRQDPGRGVLEAGLLDAHSSPMLAAAGVDPPFRKLRGDGRRVEDYD